MAMTLRTSESEIMVFLELWGSFPPLVELFVELNVKSIDVVENVIL